MERLTRQQKLHVGVQLARRLVQALSVLLVLLLVTLSLYAHYRATRAIEEPLFTRGWRGAVLLAVHERISRLPDPQRFLDANKGTLWSMRLGGLELTDPLAAAEATVASRKIHVPLLLGALIPVLLALLLGRVFCSWICPANVLFEVTEWLRSLLAFAELPPADVKFSRGNKYVLLAGGLLAAAALGLPFFALVYPPAVLGRAAHGWIFQTTAAGSILVLAVIVAVEVLISPRWWCRTMCPGGALYALLGAARPLRVQLAPQRCTGCRLCFDVCEVGLNPIRESSGLECDNCGACIRHCPEDALRFRLGASKVEQRASKIASGPAQGRTDAPASPAPAVRPGSLPLALALLLASAPAASAHHILGLPHYAYKENYPQVPQLEYPATAGPFDVLLTCYPGTPVPGERSILAVYIKDRSTGAPFTKPIRLRVLECPMFAAPIEIVPPAPMTECEVPPKTTVVFPRTNDYLVEITFDVEGKPEVIAFPLVAGDPVPAAAILGTAGSLLVLLVVVARAIRIKRRRRARTSRECAVSAVRDLRDNRFERTPDVA